MQVTGRRGGDSWRQCHRGDSWLSRFSWTVEWWYIRGVSDGSTVWTSATWYLVVKMLYIQDLRTVSIYVSAITMVIDRYCLPIIWYPRSTIPILDLLCPQWVVYTRSTPYWPNDVGMQKLSDEKQPSRPDKMCWTCHERLVPRIPGKRASARG